MSMDKLFLRDEKRSKKLYDTELLAHLLLLNYQFSNNKYHNISANEIFKNLHKIKYSKKDLEQIKNTLYLAFEGMKVSVINKSDAQNEIPIFLRLDDSRLLKNSSKNDLKAKLQNLKVIIILEIRFTVF